MPSNFEFDKIVLSIALAIFTYIFSNNFAGIIYTPSYYIDKRGYEIPVVEATGGTAVAKGIPDEIDIVAIMATADPAAGKEQFNKCAVCHTHEKGAANKVGPNLWGIVGANVASHSNFSYSNAMLNLGKTGAKWGFEELYRYIYAPAKYVVGTKMAFAGIKNDQDRSNLIAYLRTLADNPQPVK